MTYFDAPIFDIDGLLIDSELYCKRAEREQMPWWQRKYLKAVGGMPHNPEGLGGLRRSAEKHCVIEI